MIPAKAKRPASEVGRYNTKKAGPFVPLGKLKTGHYIAAGGPAAGMATTAKLKNGEEETGRD